MAAALESAGQGAGPLDSETNIDIRSSPAAEVDEGESASTAEDASEAATGVEEDSVTETATETKVGGGLVVKKWPGWPGDNVFRLIVPLLKVGSIIGRKGELIKKLCEETRARVRVLEAPIGVNDSIVLISGKEELEAKIPPAMDAVLRIFKHVNGIPDSVPDHKNSESTAATCSVRLLVASSQAANLIGKKGEAIKSIQERSNAAVRVIGDFPFYAAADEKIVDIQGEPMNTLKALEAVIQHLRKFLVDHSVLPLFERSYNMPVTQERPAGAWGDINQPFGYTGQQSAICSDYDFPIKRDAYYLDHESRLELQVQRGGFSLYGQDLAVSDLHSSAFGRTGSGLEVTHRMQIPLAYAEDIIGIGGRNIAYMRRTSGAAITIEESRGMAGEITVEIKGTSSEVHIARQLIQDFVASRTEPLSSNYSGLDTGLRSSYPSSQSYDRYGSSGLGSYGGYRV